MWIWYVVTGPFALLFAVAVWLRNWMFDHGWRRVKRLDKPVISVGNLAMGGTGKTPVCVSLLRILVQMGYQPALLSRGYGRRLPKRALRVTQESHWLDVGDEPLMIARSVPQAFVAVGPTRWDAAMTLSDHPVDVFVVDDGFQHRQLARDLDILLWDVTQKKPTIFPWGKFREGLSGLRRADLVVFTRSDGVPVRLAEIVKQVNPSATCVSVGFRPGVFRTTLGDPLDLRPGTPVGAFAGIAFPDRFFEQLRRQGFELIDPLGLGDHKPLTLAQFRSLCETARTRQLPAVITTYKDAVKLEHPTESDIVIGFQELETHWEDEERLRQFLLKYL